MKRLLIYMVIGLVPIIGFGQKDSISLQELKIIQLDEEVDDLKDELDKQREEYQGLIEVNKENNLLIYDKADKRLTYLIWAIGIIAGLLGLLIRFVGKDAISKYFDDTAKDFTKEKIDSIITEEWLKTEVENRAQEPINEAIEILRQKFQEDAKKEIQKLKSLQQEYESSLEKLKQKGDSREIGKIEDQEEKDILALFEKGLKSIKQEKDYTAEDWYYNGEAEFDEGNLEEAIRSFTASVELNPENHRARHWLGYVFDELGKYEKAIHYYDQAIEINPEYAIAFYNRGIAKDNLEKYEEAIKDYDRAIEINPEYDDAFNNRGNAKDSLEKYEEAIKDYDRAIEINPDFALAFNNRGNTKTSLEKYEEAIKDYDRAIEINPEHANAHYNKGLTFQKQGNMTQACEAWKKAVELGSKEAQEKLEEFCKK